MASIASFDLSHFSRANDSLQRTRRSLYLAALVASLAFVIGAELVILIYAPSRDGIPSAILQFTGGLLILIAALMMLLFSYRQLRTPASALEIRSDGIVLSTDSGGPQFVSWREESPQLSIQVRTADARLPPEAHYRLVAWPRAPGLYKFAIPFSQVIPYNYIPRQAAEQLLEAAAASGVPISVERNAELRENRKPVTIYRINVPTNTPVQTPYSRGEGLGCAEGS